MPETIDNLADAILEHIEALATLAERSACLSPAGLEALRARLAPHEERLAERFDAVVVLLDGDPTPGTLDG